MQLELHFKKGGGLVILEKEGKDKGFFSGKNVGPCVFALFQKQAIHFPAKDDGIYVSSKLC